jgi:hypothetical protein
MDQLILFNKWIISDRKTRLFAIACQKQILPYIKNQENEITPELINYIEYYLTQALLYADGYLSDNDVIKLCIGSSYNERMTIIHDITFAILSPSTNQLISYLRSFFDITTKHKINQCNILRDILGNPYRPQFNIPKLSSRINSIAENIYKEEDFESLPILADILEDEGYDNESVLKHLRDPVAQMVHVKGCWALDLILGKS